jgi:putative transposase
VATAFRHATAPAGGSPGVVRGLLADLLRTKKELLAENAMLRQQLIVATRKLKRPRFRTSERVLLVALASMFTRWRDALVLVKPETVLRWHRQGFRLLWTWRSKSKSRPRSRLATAVVELIRRMAIDNRLWGAERIRGELLKLGYSAAKSTIQRYMSRFRSTAPEGQRWSSFLRNQAQGIWCCDLFEVRDLWFRCHYVFVVMHLETRRLLCAVSTNQPTAEWLAQQLRQLTPFGTGPKFLIRDNDAKFGVTFDAVARGIGTEIIRTPIGAPKANAHVERLIGSLRRECFDHLIILGEAHLEQALDEYRAYFNGARPHQGIGQRRPESSGSPAPASTQAPIGAIVARPVLGGLHHEYRLAS